MSRTEAFAFVAGGTVQAGGGVYLERQADRDLLEHCRAGDFTYILTSRQMGKSSLMIRTAERLAAEGALPVIVDLTEFGAQTTAEQWYKGFLFAVQDQLSLRTSSAEWWAAQADHAFGHRFTRYLRDVALVERSERLVIFVDEIDTTLRLDFTDDFFAAVRFLYQNRAAEPALQRLSFVLIGVARPGDLIKDASRTPFNIGHRIELTDFTLDEACSLTSHLPVPPPVGRDLVAWTLGWTGGHPYLTLRAIRSLTEAPPQEWTSEAINTRIRTLFLQAGAETDSNLQFVGDMLTKKAFNREAVLRMYGRVRRGERVPDQELDQVTSWLKLSGIVCRRDGLLRVRNAIYEQVFDERWALDHLRLNVNWRRRLASLAAILLVLTVLITIPLATYAWRQKTEAEFQARQAQLERDEATRQRVLAENSLADTTAALKTAQQAVDALKRLDPESAAVISAQVASAREEAQKNISDLTADLRKENDALRKQATANQRPAGPRADASTRTTAPKASTPPPQTPEEAEIRRVLRAYEAAYALRSVDALRRVRVLSSAETKAARAEFADAASYQIVVDKEDIRLLDSRKAIVTARMSSVVAKRDRVLQGTVLVEFTMEKRGDTWMIVSVR
jgi:hypothetical protein